MRSSPTPAWRRFTTLSTGRARTWPRSREEVESSLTTQGYRVLEVREAPDRLGHEFVFITERTA